MKDRMTEYMTKQYTPGTKLGGLTISDVWWLSFASEQGNLGVAIVRGVDNLGAAVLKAHRLGINPGGAVRGMALAVEGLDWIPVGDIERLLSPAEAMKLTGEIDARTAAEKRS